jgi:DNA-binding NarL/FixJ family response regulator
VGARLTGCSPATTRREHFLVECAVPIGTALCLATYAWLALADGDPERAVAPRLIAREQAVAGLVTHGLTNREIADELVIGVKTVEHHLGAIFVKLDVSSRTQLVVAMASH